MDWTLRIELWDNNINIPPNIIFNIQNVKLHLCEIMKEVASKMPGWKFLDRCEASICTENEEKQIRNSNWYDHNSAFFNFCSYGSLKITIDEWKQFAKVIEFEINCIIHAECGVLLISDLSSENE